MKIEVGKTYESQDGAIKIIHDLGKPCAGYGRFVGIMDNGVGYNYPVTVTEDGKTRMQASSQISDSRQITGETETFLVLKGGNYVSMEGTAQRLTKRYGVGNVFRRVEVDVGM